MTNRWFKVKAERIDWIPKPNTMICYKRGHIGYMPQNFIDYGLKIGAIEVIKKPTNAKVGKDGKVIWDAN